MATCALVCAAIALWQVFNGQDVAPIVIAFFAPFVAFEMGLEVVRGIRALHAPTRRRFELTRRSLGFLIATCSALVFGVATLVDDDPQTSDGMGVVLVVLGAALAVSFLLYLAKPVHDVDSA